MSDKKEKMTIAEIRELLKQIVKNNMRTIELDIAIKNLAIESGVSVRALQAEYDIIKRGGKQVIEGIEPILDNEGNEIVSTWELANLKLKEKIEKKTVIQAREKAMKILAEGDPLHFITNSYSEKHCGDKTLGEVLALSIAVQSDASASGIQPKISGPTGSGKSHACKTIFRHIPLAYKMETSISPKVLFYLEFLEGTTLLIDDVSIDEGLEGTVKRSCTNFQEPTKHTVVIKNEVHEKEIPKRLNWWFTSVNEDQSEQLLSRQFQIDIDDTAKVDRHVFEMQLKNAKLGLTDNDITENILISREIFREIKRHEFITTMPFIHRISNWGDLSHRRNFPLLLDLIRGFALFRFMQRKVNKQDDGLWLLSAQEEDFYDAYNLYATRVDNQRLKMSETEILVCKEIARHAVTGIDLSTLTINLQRSSGWLYKVLHGRRESPDSGLLGRIVGLTMEKSSEEITTNAGVKRRIMRTLYYLKGMEATESLTTKTQKQVFLRESDEKKEKAHEPKKKEEPPKEKEPVKEKEPAKEETDRKEEKPPEKSERRKCEETILMACEDMPKGEEIGEVLLSEKLKQLGYDLFSKDVQKVLSELLNQSKLVASSTGRYRLP